jgi:hypothetical protein
MSSRSFVQAIVTQQQPAYLAAVLNLTTVNIGATAIAKVQKLANPCALALTGSLSFQGNPDIDTPTCGLASNSTAKNAIDFTGGVHNFNVGSLSAAGAVRGLAVQRIAIQRQLTHHQSQIHSQHSIN